MKLGLKKKDAGKNTDAKKEKKRKGRSDGAGSDAAKQWLIQNVEKVVLSVMGLLTLYMVWTGFRMTGLPEDKAPEKLKQATQRAKEHMNRDVWNQVRAIRYPEPDTFKDKAMLDTKEVKLDDYPAPKPLHPLLKEAEKLRTIPDVLAAIDLEVTAGYGPLAIKPEETSDIPSFGGNIDDGSRSIPDNLQQRYSSQFSTGEVRSTYFATIMGLVPLREQLKLFNDAFIGAAEYDLGRDFPLYLKAEIQRREMTSAGPGNWVALDVDQIKTASETEWGDTREDVVADIYLDQTQNVVMRIPPIVGQDVTALSIHTKTKSQAQVDAEDQIASQAEQDRTQDLDTRERRRPDNQHTATMVPQKTPTEVAFERLKSDIGFFRFYDMSVEAGKSYQYQVRLLLDDPNNPESGDRPTIEACDERIIEQRQANAGSPFSYLITPWSDPSPTVTIPYGGTVLIASSSGVKKVTKNSPVVSGEPSAKVLAVAWDELKSMEVPVEVESARRGSLLNLKLDAEAVDPAQNKVVPLKGYSLATNAVILDIKGGEVLYSRQKDKVSRPARLLVVTKDNQIRLQHEIVDYERYQKNVILPDLELTNTLDRSRKDGKAGDREERGRGGERERGNRGRGNRGRTRPDRSTEFSDR